jgi:hypothetical protein
VVLGGENYDEMLMELSEPVRAAVDEAAKLVESLVGRPGGDGGGIESGGEPDVSTRRR